MPGFSLSSINFRSPITWVVIIGGGVGVYLLYRHFAGSSTSSSTTDPPVDAVGTSLFLTDGTPAPSTGATGTTASPAPTTPAPTKPPTSKAPTPNPAPAPAPTVPTKAATKTAPAKTTAPARNDLGLVGQTGEVGVPISSGTQKPVRVPVGVVSSNAAYTHVSTWPYGEQVVRSRLG